MRGQGSSCVNVVFLFCSYIMKCTLYNVTVLFSNCTNISSTDVHRLALVRGTAGILCFSLCLATFVFELLYICQLRRKTRRDGGWKKTEGTTTLQRLFVYLTFSNILYTAALSLHIEEYFPLKNDMVHCFVCKAVGFFDQYSGSVQLLLTVGIIMKLFHKLCSLKPQTIKTGILSRHHYKFEAAFVILCFVLPLVVNWVPFTQHGAGEYGLDGAWCWIQVIQNDCTDSRTGFLEQLWLWYIPYAIVSGLGVICILVIIGVLIYVRHRTWKSIRGVILDTLLLLPFLVVFCSVCLIEISIVIFFKLEESRTLLHLDNYVMWMFYAVVTPVGGVVIPIAFLIYHLRKKNFTSLYQRLHNVSNAGDHTFHPSSRESIDSDSDKGRPNFKSRSDVQWNTSTGSAVVINTSLVGKSKYGTMD